MEELVLSRTKIDHDQDAHVQLEKHVTKSYVYKFAKVLRQKCLLVANLCV